VSVRHSLQGIAFEWDPRKAAANRRKHGVDFEQACEAFFDPFVRAVDPGRESDEAREAIVGMTVGWRLLQVVFIEWNDVFRIISARPATGVERRLYEEQ
jgi:uncharacterized DUF497 family protein